MQNEIPPNPNNEITLLEIANFLKRSRRQIGVGVLCGLIFSSAYLFLTPKKYDAVWQMQMAQFGSSTTNIEEPPALIQYLRFSSNYPSAVLQICEQANDEEIGDYLDKNLGVQSIKTVASTVEFKFRSGDIVQARKCAEAITQMVIEHQKLLIEERLSGRQEQLALYQQAMRDQQQKLEKIQSSELSGFSYLAAREQLNWLRTRIDSLQEEALLSQKHPAKIIAPIVVSNKPAFPKRSLTLLVGLLLGLVFGILLALIRNGLRKSE